MCQYSAEDGIPNDWHLVHLGSRAVGRRRARADRGSRASRPRAASRRGTPASGRRSRCEAWKPIAAFIKAQGAVPGIQLAHAGRKASCDKPWDGGKPLARDAGGWRTHGPERRALRRLSGAARHDAARDLEACVADFRLRRRPRAAGRLRGGRDPRRARLPAARVPLAAVEPARRRVRRLPRQPHALAAAVVARGARRRGRRTCPCSCASPRRDWKEGGWDLEQSIALRRRSKELGVDLVDVLERRQRRATRRSRSGPATRCPSPRPSAATPASRRRGRAHHRARAGRAHPRRRARPTRSASRARCCATPTGRATPRRRSAWRWPGRNQYKRCDDGPLGR